MKAVGIKNESWNEERVIQNPQIPKCKNPNNKESGSNRKLLPVTLPWIAECGDHRDRGRATELVIRNLPRCGWCFGCSREWIKTYLLKIILKILKIRVQYRYSVLGTP